MSARKKVDGRELAIKMLLTIERNCHRGGIVGQGNYCIWDGDISDGEYVPNRDDPNAPQDNIVAREIAKLNGDPEQIKRFGAILTDWISCSHVGDRNLDAYSPEWERRTAERISEYQKRTH